MNTKHSTQILSALMLLQSLLLLMSCGGGGGGASDTPATFSSSASPTTSSASAASSSSVASKLSLGVAADAEMQKLFTTTGATAATFAVAKNGKIIFEKSYGYQDSAKTLLLKTDALMRTGSIIKPVTAAAIRILAKNGTLALTDHVFCTGNNAPCWLAQELLPPTADVRVKDINIQHLISHQGGWLMSISGDAAYMEVEIKNSLKLDRPPTREEIITYYMSKPLGYNPGQSTLDNFDDFSNFGFMLLGLIIEKASHQTYTHFVQTEIMAPLTISDLDFKAGASRLVDRDPREPAYVTTDMCISVYTGNNAICAEEMREVLNWQSVGFSITTARAMALFSQHYFLATHDYGFHDANTGSALTSFPTTTGRFNGDMQGLTSVVKQLPSGVSYAVFINKTIIDSNSTNLPYYSNYFDEVSQLNP